MEKTIPLLWLRVEKGPRKGETFDCNKKRKITIGRVVKGNTFVIKEGAISQKHFLVELNDANKWTLTDLNTSNGTIFNDARLPPNEPYFLNNGDVIKIGAETIIIVQIEQPHPQKAAPPPPAKRRRNPNRNPNAAVAAQPVAESVVDSSGRAHETVGNLDGHAGPENMSVAEWSENMSVAEWFDQMEQWLPKHLNDVSESIIRRIKEQSQQMDAYLMEKYKNDVD